MTAEHSRASNVTASGIADWNGWTGQTTARSTLLPVQSMMLKLSAEGNDHG